MSNIRIPQPKNIEGRQFDPVRLRGGLDQETDKFTVRLGTLDDALNYIPSTRGYQRAKGLFHFDGTIDSAVSNMWIVEGNNSQYLLTGSGFTIGGTVSWGDDSTGKVVYYELRSGATDYLVLGITEILNGPPVIGDTLFDGETSTTLFLAALSNQPSELVDALDPETGLPLVGTITEYLEFLNDNVNSALVGQSGVVVNTPFPETYHGVVPGIGAITGGWQYKDDVYVVRNAYSATFSAGTLEFKPGDTVEIEVGGGGTEQVDVARVELTSGLWVTGTASGWVVFIPSSSTTDFTSLDSIDTPGAVNISPGGAQMALVDSADVQYGGIVWKGTIHGWEWVDTGYTIEYDNGANSPNVKAAPLFLADLISATRETESTAVDSGTQAGDPPYIAWSNPGNVTADDNTYATCSLNSGASSRYLQAGIPADVLPQEDVRIIGIEAVVNARYTGANAPIDTTVRLINTNTGASFYLSADRARRESLTLLGTETILNGTFTDGSDQVTNGGFDSDSDWSKGDGWSIAAGLASSDASQSADSYLSQVATGLVIGELYLVKYTVTNNTLGNIVAHIGGTAGTVYPIDGSFTELIIAGASGSIDLMCNATFDGDVDNFSASLAGDAGWTQGTGWLISEDNASCDGTQTVESDLEETTYTSVPGKTYSVTYTQSGASGNGTTPIVGGTAGTTETGNGTFTELIVAGDASTFRIRAGSTFVGNIDDVSSKLADEDYTYGSSVDTWGVDELSAEDVNSGNMSVLVQYSNETAGSGQAEVDYISVNIYYVPNTEKVWFNDGSDDVANGVIHAFQIDGGDFGAPDNAYGNMSFMDIDDPAAIGVGMVMYSEPSQEGVVVATVTAAPEYNLLPSSDDMTDASSKYLSNVSNYYENDDSEAVYGVTGASSAFTYDGDSFAFIRAPLARSIDKPRHIAFHDNRLALGYESGHVILSAVAVPNDYSAVDSASSWGVGDRVTGLISLAGNVLGVFSESSIRTLEGSSAETGTMRTLSSTQGCSEYTLQNIIGPYFANNSGIDSLPTTDKYGDFIPVKVSDPIRTWIQDRMQARRTTQTQDIGPVMSIAIHSENQYRLYFADGYSLVMYFRADGRVEPTIMHYDTANFAGNYVPTFLNSFTLSNGRERVIMGTEAGEVWVVDGANIIQHPSANVKPICYITTNPVNFGRPDALHKHYHVMIQGRFYGAQGVDTWGDDNYKFDVTGTAHDSFTFGSYTNTPIFHAKSEIDSAYIPILTDGYSLKIQTTMDGSKPHTLQSLVYRASRKGVDRNSASKTY